MQGVECVTVGYKVQAATANPEVARQELNSNINSAIQRLNAEGKKVINISGTFTSLYDGITSHVTACILWEKQ